MELYIFLGIVGGGLILILIVVLMLNRAWGSFGQTSGLPPAQPPLPPAPPPIKLSSLSSELPSNPPPEQGQLPAGAPEGSMVPVTHPLVRQAVIAAIERGGNPTATYFIKDGDAVYLVPSRIADLQQRQIALRIFTSLNQGDGGNISFKDIIRVVQELGRKQ
jgi:hypothetical protein